MKGCHFTHPEFSTAASTWRIMAAHLIAAMRFVTILQAPWTAKIVWTTVKTVKKSTKCSTNKRSQPPLPTFLTIVRNVTKNTIRTARGPTVTSLALTASTGMNLNATNPLDFLTRCRYWVVVALTYLIQHSTRWTW